MADCECYIVLYINHQHIRAKGLKIKAPALSLAKGTLFINEREKGGV